MSAQRAAPRRKHGEFAFKCMGCGRKFATTASAERASSKGCPKCGEVDIDVDVDVD